MNTGRDLRVFSSNGWGFTWAAGAERPISAETPRPRHSGQQDTTDLDASRHGYQADGPQSIKGFGVNPYVFTTNKKVKSRATPLFPGKQQP